MFPVQVIQAALKGLQFCLMSEKWKFAGEELGTTLALLKVQNCTSFLVSQLAHTLLSSVLRKHFALVSAEAHVPRYSRCECGVASGALPSTSSSVRVFRDPKARRGASAF